MRIYKIDKINKTIIFDFPKSDEIIEQIKNCGFTARFDKYGKNWIVSVSNYTKPLIKNIVKDYGFKYVEEKPIEQKKFNYSLSDERFSKISTLCDEHNFTLTPRDYQKHALAFGLSKGNIINGDDVGCGKSFSSIMYTETTNSFPCLVVVPASVKYNWFEKWGEIVTKKRTISVIESAKKDNNWNADVVIINYDIIGKKASTGATVKFSELEKIDWKMVIFDEAHFLKNSKSQRSKAALKIVKKKPITQLLSGTITMSKPIELWNLLKIAKVDHLIASSWIQFVEKYCGGYQGKRGWVTDGATNTLELNRKLRETCYIRREKRDVLKELPDSIQQVLKVDISNKRAIDKATNEFIDYMYTEHGDKAAERAMEAEHLVSLGVLRKLAIEGKLKAIEKYLKDWLESGKKLLIFALHREPLDYLSKKFKSKLIAGGVTAKKKQEIVKEWKENDDTFLFANMISAGTGVDGLQEVCSDALVLELPWRPSDIEQLIGRIDRLGQKLVTSITYMLSFETIDLQMWQMLEEKEKVTEAVNKGVDIEHQNSGMKTVMKKLLEKKVNVL